MIRQIIMPQYYVEGLYANKHGVKKKHKIGSYPASSIEPYAKTIWANSPKEALQIATSELEGGEWTEGPHLSQVTEEQHMRSLGAPEFPGLAELPSKSRKRK
jgi:hypothetical protein